MIIGIAGPADVGNAWEKRLRKSSSVTEVVLAPQVSILGQVDACIITSSGEESYTASLEALRLGFPVFMVGRLLKAKEQTQRLYLAAEESRVPLQVSHWASFTPSTTWMMNHLAKPDFIHIQREVSHTDFRHYGNPFTDLWLEDVGFVLKMAQSSVHRIFAHQAQLDSEKTPALHIGLQFDNGCSAMIFATTQVHESRHIRMISDTHHTLLNDVRNQHIRVGKKSQQGELYFEHIELPREEPADVALKQFIKAIQMKSVPVFSGFDAYLLAKTLEEIRSKLK